MDAERRRRADARRGRITLRKSHLQTLEADLSPVRGAEALSLVTRLTRESWAMAGLPEPTYSRAQTPCRFVPRSRP